ncbi:MAG: hypothetical protein EOO15_20185 [Chitinophagaceae bacterium]|nr:MAG: hypothetical protein EOO15_20185 [Chitinophagaceae bacterium]
MNKTSSIAAVAILSVGAIVTAHASRSNYSGTWEMDLRSASERNANAECGFATFKLKQAGHNITGEHSFATVGCGRLNEGGKGTVQGKVQNGKAVLVVTSGRNGAVVRGIAELQGSNLLWQTLEEIKPGAPEGDSPLILRQGVLHRVGK